MLFCVFYSDRFSQNAQRTGPFGFAASSSLMRSCRYLETLEFDCCDWSACVASDSWAGLDVPPSDVIARGTEGVFEFVKDALQDAVYFGGKRFEWDCESIELDCLKLSEDKLLPILKMIKDGKFSRLQGLKLVRIKSFFFDVTASVI
jgi:hypothetical protein